MKSLMMTFAACALLCAVSESAQAGSSKSSTIHVVNQSTVVAAVIIDNVNPPTNSVSAFDGAGGEFLLPGESADFKVTAGTRVVVARPIVGGAIGANQASVPFNVPKNGTKNVKITNTDNFNVILSAL
jgi:hypothetical protein